VSDRATQFGDGCFTTARIHQGEVCFLAEHIRRLQTPVKNCLSRSPHGTPWQARWFSWR
jgi:branched-subunit amino acid aminotransferase/4-amino-4-deoxychorismate lyase